MRLEGKQQNMGRKKPTVSHKISKSPQQSVRLRAHRSLAVLEKMPKKILKKTTAVADSRPGEGTEKAGLDGREFVQMKTGVVECNHRLQCLPGMAAAACRYFSPSRHFFSPLHGLSSLGPYAAALTAATACSALAPS